MKILVTGSKGFVGKNMIAHLEQNGFTDIVKYDIDSPENLLDDATKNCDFVLHFAGVNRPKDNSEFIEGNFGFTTKLLDKLKLANNKAPILITSSIQASLDNDYGKSKKLAEDYIFSYSKENSVKAYVYRLPNVFGKWSRPNYNSAIATFCYNVSRDLPICVNDPNVDMSLIYIDDLCMEIVDIIKKDKDNSSSFTNSILTPNCIHKAKLGQIVDFIKSFKSSRQNLLAVNLEKSSLSSKLYSTYLSFLPENSFSYELKMNVDQRGSFTEFLKTNTSGQVSVNVSKPGITKGNHWHHFKNEKFLVVSGKAIIRFRKIGDDKVIEYVVSEDKLEVVDIPTGYTHNIENISDKDLVTVMWANEPFNPDFPDTYFEEV